MRYKSRKIRQIWMWTLWEAQQYNCFLCRRPLLEIHKTGQYKIGDGESWTFDHLIPLTHGGGYKRNIVIAHKKCNNLRGNEMPSKFEIKACHDLWDSIETTLKIKLHSLRKVNG